MPRYYNKEELQSEIARLKLSYYTDKQIIDLLQIPERTYYYHLKQWRETISQLMKERDAKNVEGEIHRCKQGLEEDIQELTKIAREAEQPTERINAVKERAKIRVDLVKLEHEGPEVIKQHDTGQSNTNNNIEQKQEQTETSS